MQEILGIFGGTFDPPHLGHLTLAAKAFDELKLTRLLWVLTPHAPHKLNRQISAPHHRLEMLTRAIQGVPGFEISTVEMDRPGPHFTLDTIKLLQAQYPDARLVLLMGSDLLPGFPKWKGSRELIRALYRIGVMRRPGHEIDLSSLAQTHPNLAARLVLFDNPALEISSSSIRQRITSSEAYCYHLPTSVCDYIQQNQPYSRY